MIHHEKMFPITWKAWDQQDTLAFSYYEVEFLEDFGIFKKGEKLQDLFVDYGEGLISSILHPEEEPFSIERTQKIIATPKLEN